MKRRRHVLTTAALALTMLGSAASGAQAAKSTGGNSLSAKACQKGGWQLLMTSTTRPFVNEADCVSYAAGGGVLYLKRAIYFAVELDRATCITYSDGSTACDAKLVGYGLIPGEKWTLCLTKPGLAPDCYLSGYVAADGTVDYDLGRPVCVPGWDYDITVTWAATGLGCR